MREAVDKHVPEPLSADAVAWKLVDAHSFTVQEAKFVKHKVEQKFVEKAKMVNRFLEVADAIEEKTIRQKTKFCQEELTSSDFQALRRKYPTIR